MRHLTSSSCLMAATAAAVALLSACADSRPLQVASPETVMQTTGVGSISAVVTRQDVQFDDKFYFPYEGQHSGTKADFPKGFLPAYGSGLALKGRRADGTLEFYAITDRGPNATTGPVTQITDGSNSTGFASSTVFPSPNFTPSIGVITLGKDGARLVSTLPLKFSAAQNANGRVQPRGITGEQVLDDSFTYPGKAKGYSEFGLDTESVVVDAARNVLWVSDEYGPFIVKIDPATGIILKKYKPGTGVADLPAILAKRRANRGMEGLSIDVASGKLHGFLQSPLNDGKADYTTAAVPDATGKSENVRDYARFVRWVEFDPTTEKTRLFALPVDGSWYSQGKTGNAKLGDVVSLGNGKFIAIEQGTGKDKTVFNDLVLIEFPANATDITALGSDLEKSSLTGKPVNGSDYSRVVALKKTRLFNLNATGWVAEKAEGLALVDDYTLALTNDTDFGVSLAVLDASGKEIEGSDVTKCMVDADGKIVNDGKCAKGAASLRFTTNDVNDRAQRLWTFRFSKKLSEYGAF
ncbi:esterase-like activity of phytase family protein [Comamonas thiooxydans]|uniref:esterase-like activity of phytase family protein n=1 Tax=Comamonas thiooxydans TaxID=363952 RepID=UPI000B4224C7|nr:esterase-like activity of phytase family protein [Comamonas thiooxydans]